MPTHATPSIVNERQEDDHGIYLSVSRTFGHDDGGSCCTTGKGRELPARGVGLNKQGMSMHYQSINRHPSWMMEREGQQANLRNEWL